MANARAQANQRLYYAAVLLDGWRAARDAQQVPATIVDAAFGESVRAQLLMAYGWFLLELVQPAVLPAAPPTCCADLPSPAPGIAIPGEIREFRQLEQSGWLRDMLVPHDAAVPATRTPRGGNLATGGGESGFDLESAQGWHQQLSELMERMSQSLDEC